MLNNLGTSPGTLANRGRRPMLLASMLLLALLSAVYCVLPATTAPQLDQLERRFTKCVRALAFNADGQVLASGDDQGVVTLWNVATGTKRGTLTRSQLPIRSLAISPDGRLLAVAMGDLSRQRGALLVLDVATGAPVAAPDLLGGAMTCVAFAPDGHHLVAGGSDGRVRYWETASWNCAAIHHAHQDDVICLAFSPGGDVVATGGVDQTLRVWDAATWRQRAGPPPAHRPIRSLAFSSDGRTLASVHGDDPTIHFWDLDRERGHAVPLHTPMQAITWAANGRDLVLVAGGWFEPGEIIVWDGSRQRPRHVLRGHDKMARTVAVARQGDVFATAGNDGRINLWDTRVGALRHSLRASDNLP